jgi:UDP-N-acetylglucosamine--N-acetylmuramyl-(pentapeptide) pyrophosphoryl-undecaprenol N-acetylglucosamine transferase
MTAKTCSTIAITCGGTGGHFYPGLSIARRLKAQNRRAVIFLSGRNIPSQSAEAARYGIETVCLPPTPKSRPGMIAALLKGFLSSRRELRKLKPDALLGMGSFASFPAAMAAVTLRVPLFLHDGNARVGKANRILSRFARHLGTAFPAVNGGTVKCPLDSTGMPLRPEITDGETIARAEAITRVNALYQGSLKPDLPTILIFGGSQGAAIFNSVLPAALRQLGELQFQVIHLTGKDKFEEVREVYRDAAFPALLLPSSTEMHLLYQASDLAVCRSGGSTVAELTHFGKAALLIPYPYAAELHQDDNARFYAGTGAAVILQNAGCTPEQASEAIRKLLQQPPDVRPQPSAATDGNIAVIESYLSKA